MFFTKLANLNLSQVTLGISISADNQITVSVLPKVKANDKAVNNLKPLNLSGTAEELDQQFFNIITEPINKAGTFISNVKEFEDSLTKAKNNSEFKKKAKEEVKKALQKMKDFMNSKEFNPLKEFGKAKELANKVLSLAPDNKEALKVVEDMNRYDEPTLF